MKKIAVFAEGQTEQIFIRELLLKIIDASKLKLKCIDLIAGNARDTRNEYSAPNPEIFFLVVNVNNDEGVVTSIKDREIKFMETQEFEKIIGIRDLYSTKYDKLSGGKIKKEVDDKVIEGCRLAVDSLKYKDKIQIFFAIMEVEAWFLGMYNLLSKVNNILTRDFIKAKLGFDLHTIDPQKKFYKPADTMHEIMCLCGKRYRKKKGDVENIAKLIDENDLINCVENGRCERFSAFYGEIMKIAEGNTYC